MKVFVWQRVKETSLNCHSEGGVVVFAATEERARELANVDGCAIKPEETPDYVREVVGNEERAFWMPDAGCC